jgi:hypothetical protein
MPDARHAQRRAQLVARLGEKPVRSLPRAGHGWAETGAASRCLDQPAIGLQARLSGHTHAPLDRLQTQAGVWLVPATTGSD